MIFNADDLEFLEKSITRQDAKKVHPDLPPGGVWRTMRGHHVYILNGKVIAGAVPGVKSAKKATKAQLDEHQQTVDKEKGSKNAKTTTPSKTSKAPSTKTKTKKPAPASTKGAGKTGAKASEVTKPAKKTKASEATKTRTKATAPKGSKTTKQATNPEPTKLTDSGKPKTRKKKADIRSDKQQNNEVAYDVGQKVGGARKDLAVSVERFKEKPTYNSLEDLEKASPEMAQKFVTKSNILPSSADQFITDHKNGVELEASMLKNLIYDRIASKPVDATPEGRKAYLSGIIELRRVLEPITTLDDLWKAVRDLSDRAYKAYNYDRSNQMGLDYRRRLLSTGRDSYGRELSEYDKQKYTQEAKEYEQKLKDASKMRMQFPFHAMGDKVQKFFTDYESRNRTLKTLRKQLHGKTWDSLLKPSEEPKQKKNKAEEERKHWQRQTVSEYMRTGGKELKIDKPEDMLKHFGLRGIEFGNWVDDSSGMYHLKRSAEAFQDLSELIGADVKDISLNGRLAMAFGARGMGGASAHYEPTSKVINMTKYGGAGSLAHEWGHALDNIMYQYSHGGAKSMSLASNGGMGDHDPVLKQKYDALMDAIVNGDGKMSGMKTVHFKADSTNGFGSYYPSMRRDAEAGMSMEDMFAKYSKMFDNHKNLVQRLAHEIRRVKGMKRDEPFIGSIKVPTGKSEYLSRMMEKGKYWSKPEEMFARVFESYIEDTLGKKKRKNNYLVWDTKTKIEGNPFPQGSEREHMTAKMHDLISYIVNSKSLKKALDFDLQQEFLKWVKRHELRKSVVDDFAGNEAYPESFDGLMFRGIGQKELDFINERGYIKSKGKGNDEDQGAVMTCYSPLYQQAEGYARSNYDLYDESRAYVLAVRKPPFIMHENELGELETEFPVGKENIVAVIPIPKG